MTMGATATAQRNGHAVASAVGDSGAARVAARIGLVARAMFYLLLAGLVASAAVNGAAGRQTNVNGAMAAIAQKPAGEIAIALAALGFFALGLVRLAGAVRDRGAGARGRLKAAAQGVGYLLITWVPISFLLGSRETGSEQSQHEQAASMLSWPAGREIVVLAGVIVIGACCRQIRAAFRREFSDGLELRSAPRWVRELVDTAGVVSHVARAVVLLPIGVFLIVAAMQSDPNNAKGLDAELGLLARQSWWGPTVLAFVTTGLVVAAIYTALEAKYRRIERAR